MPGDRCVAVSEYSAQQSVMDSYCSSSSVSFSRSLIVLIVLHEEVFIAMDTEILEDFHGLGTPAVLSQLLQLTQLQEKTSSPVFVLMICNQFDSCHLNEWLHCVT